MKEKIYFEGELINKAGVDRVVLINVELLRIEWEVFSSKLNGTNDIVFDNYKACNRTYYYTKGGDKFHRLNISDTKIGRLCFGACPLKFGIWEFSPTNTELEKNIVNFSGEKLVMFLEETTKNIYEEYGLEVSFHKCKLKEVEVNTTFALEYDFNDYYRPLNVLFSKMPYLKKKCEYSGTENTEKKLQSCSDFNNQITVTAYNKSVEMAVNLKSKEKIHIFDSKGEIIESVLMRVEFKLKRAEVCEKWFKNLNSMADFKGDMIDEVFDSLLKHYFFEPLSKWEEKNKLYLHRIIKKYVLNAKKGSKWKSKLLTELRNDELKTREVKVLDVKDLNIVISKYTDKSGHKERLLLKEDVNVNIKM